MRPDDAYRPFVKGSLAAALTGGCTLGAVLLAYMAWNRSLGVAWHSLVEVHGHLQVYGWVGLMIMGVALHVVPRFKGKTLEKQGMAKAVCYLVVAAIVTRFFSQPWAGVSPAWRGMLLVSGFLEVAGVGIFAYLLLELLGEFDLRGGQKLARGEGGVNLPGGDLPGGRGPREPFESFLLAGVFWLVVATLADAGLAGYMAWRGLEEIPRGLSNTLRYLQVGFISLWIFGVSLRTLPVFLGVEEARGGYVRPAWWLYNLALALRLVSEPLKSLVPVLRAGYGASAVMEAGAIAILIYALNVFRRPLFDWSEMDMDTGYQPFMRAGYGWLAVATATGGGLVLFEAVTGTPAARALLGAYRHAITVGFISMMILGYATKIIPVFTGEDLHNPRLTPVVFWLINAGNVMRVFFQPVAVYSGNPAAFLLMGVSGTLEVSALAFFAYNLWMTLDKARVMERKRAGQEARTA